MCHMCGRNHQGNGALESHQDTGEADIGEESAVEDGVQDGGGVWDEGGGYDYTGEPETVE